MEAFGVAAAPLPHSRPFLLLLPMWLKCALLWAYVGFALKLTLYMAALLNDMDEERDLKPVPADGLVTLRRLRTRVSEYLSNDDVVDDVLMFAAQARGWIVENVFMLPHGPEGPLHDLHHGWSALHAWPDRSGRAKLLSVATAMPGKFRILRWQAHPMRLQQKWISLKPAGRIPPKPAIAMFRSSSDTDTRYPSAVVVFCHTPLPEGALDALSELACTEGLGTRWNSSAVELWADGPCFALALFCDAVWSYSVATSTPRLRCWEETTNPDSTMSLRLSPDNRMLVVRSGREALDFLWRFADGRNPRLLQEHIGECQVGRVAPSRVFDDRRGDFSRDGSLYVTGNASHIIAYEVATAQIAVAIAAAQDTSAFVGVRFRELEFRG